MTDEWNDPASDRELLLRRIYGSPANWRLAVWAERYAFVLVALALLIWAGLPMVWWGDLFQPLTGYPTVVRNPAHHWHSILAYLLPAILALPILGVVFAGSVHRRMAQSGLWEALLLTGRRADSLIECAWSESIRIPRRLTTVGLAALAAWWWLADWVSESSLLLYVLLGLSSMVSLAGARMAWHWCLREEEPMPTLHAVLTGLLIQVVAMTLLFITEPPSWKQHPDPPTQRSLSRGVGYLEYYLEAWPRHPLPRPNGTAPKPGHNFNELAHSLSPSGCIARVALLVGLSGVAMQILRGWFPPAGAAPGSLFESLAFWGILQLAWCAIVLIFEGYAAVWQLGAGCLQHAMLLRWLRQAPGFSAADRIA